MKNTSDAAPTTVCRHYLLGIRASRSTGLLLCSPLSTETRVDKRKPSGQYRTEPSDGHTPMVYIVGGGPARYVTEAAYRASGLEPDFDKLPTEDEYDA